MLRGGEFEQKEIEVEVAQSSGTPIGRFDIPGMPPQVINLGEMMKGMFGPRRRSELTVEAARRLLEQEEADQLRENDRLTKDDLCTPRTMTPCSSTNDKVAARTMEGGFPAATSRARACSATCCR